MSTSIVLGLWPSAPWTGERSSSEAAKLLDAAQARMPIQRRCHAIWAARLSKGGSALARARAKRRKKTEASLLHRPPTSKPRTTSLARAPLPQSSGYVPRFRREAACKATPSHG